MTLHMPASEKRNLIQESPTQDAPASKLSGNPFYRGASYDQAYSALAPVQMQGGSETPAFDPLTSGPDATAPKFNDSSSYSVGASKNPDGTPKFHGTVKGTGGGNRMADNSQYKFVKDPSDPTGKKGQWVKGPASNTQSGLPSVPKPTLDKILSDDQKSSTEQKVLNPVTGKEESVKNQVYTETEVGAGTASGITRTPDGKIDWIPKVSYGKDGLKISGGPSVYGQAGAKAKTGITAKGEVEGAAGKAAGKANAYAEAYVGASGKAGMVLDPKTGLPIGVSASGAAGLGAEAGVSVDGSLTSPELAVEGVDKALTAGVGVHGEAVVAAKAGIGADLSLTRDKVGLEAKAGALAGVELKGDVSGNIGPIGAKAGVGFIVGAGAGIEGGIVYENGKFRVGYRAYAALGYGASTEGTVTIDVKQAVQLAAAVGKKAVDLGIQGAKAAYKWADEDNDGKLSLNDVGAKIGNTAEAGAKKVDKGVDSLISTLDRDNDGKFTTKDVAAIGSAALEKGGEMVDAGKKKAGELYDAGKEKAGELKDAVKAKGKELYQGAKDTVNAGMAKGKELYEAVDTPEERAALLEKGKQKLQAGVNQGVALAKQKGEEAYNWSRDAVDAAGKKLGELKDSATKKGTEIYEGVRDYDYAGKGRELYEGAKTKGQELYAGAKDTVNAGLDKGKKAYESVRDFDYKGAAVEAKDKIVETGQAAKKKALELVDKGKQTVEAGAKKVVEKASQAKDAVVKTYQKFDTPEERAEQAAKAKRWAQQKAAMARKKAAEAKAYAEKKAAEAKAWAAKKAAEAKAKAAELARKAKETIQKAPERIAKKAYNTYKAASDSVGKAYNTAADGVSKAGSTLKSAGRKLYNFFSDRRLKEKIAHVGVSPSGLNIYDFNYIGKPGRYRGVMAQELLESRPDAVVNHSSGYYQVNYSVLDVPFERIDGGSEQAAARI